MNDVRPQNTSTLARKFHLDRANGKLMGVCSGLGKHFGIDPMWLRVGFVAATLLGFGFPIILYLAIGLIAD